MILIANGPRDASCVKAVLFQTILKYIEIRYLADQADAC